MGYFWDTFRILLDTFGILLGYFWNTFRILLEYFFIILFGYFVDTFGQFF